ncbi:MAG TPA: transglycosylase domain-containing protein [Marmoricola sp.]
MSASTPRSGSNRSARGRGTASSRKATSKPHAKGRKPKLTGKEKVRRGLKYLLVAGVVGALIMSTVFYIAYRATDIPSPNAEFQTQTTNVYYAGGKTKIGRFATQNRESIPLADIPQVMQDAVVAAEDRTFWTNKGIDPKGILRAAFSNAKGGSTQGASTITQQYVKILYLTQQRTLKRKIKEAFLSLKIHQQQSKSEILEGYLNTIYFGRGAYGVEAASRAYFGIPAKELNASQSAMLAAVLNSPNYLSPDRSDASREALLTRYDYVVSSMASMDALEESEAAEISGRLPKVKKPSTSNLYGGQRGFMLDLVKDELLGLGFEDSEIDGGGLRVTTTFTKKAMEAAEKAVAEERPEDLGDKQLHAATASVDVKTGGLLGFYGGQDFLQSQLNWAQRGGSPGSTFKAFAVAAGIKDGFSLKDTFDGNAPYVLPDGTEIGNQGEGRGRSYGSSISLLQATENSVNTAFVDLTMSMDGDGPQKVIDAATSLGIPKNARGLEPFPAVALGSATVAPMDMANAYASIANGGVRHDLHVVTKVTRASDGEVLFQHKDSGSRALKEDVAADTSYALQQVVRSGTGTSARLDDRPAAGKTGTATNDDGDVISSWFVGYTPQVATAVMYVRGNGYKPLNDFLPVFYGGAYPAQTWNNVMTRMMDGVPVEDFPPPANLDGKAPSSGHEPYTPPPKPTKTPKPKPTPTPSPTPSAPPKEPTANGTCDPAFGFPADPDCPKPAPTPTPTTTCAPLDATCEEGGGPGNNRTSSYDQYGTRQESAA